MELWKVFAISFFIISTFGTLLHFTHGWFKKGILLHVFSALNESTWEHMKLLLAPTLMVIVFQYFVFAGQYKNFWNAILFLLFIEIMSMPLLFESLRIIMKKVSLWITILIFYISIALGLLSEYLILTRGILILGEFISIIFIIIIFLLFVAFSYIPPKWFLFKDPISKKYGDYGHKD